MQLSIDRGRLKAANNGPFPKQYGRIITGDIDTVDTAVRSECWS